MIKVILVAVNGFHLAAGDLPAEVSGQELARTAGIITRLLWALKQVR